MGILSWLSTKEVDEFAKSLALTLAKRYPPAIDASGEKKVSENRLTRVLEETFDQAVEFQQANKLGIFRKARLGSEFKWQLKGLGYTDKFVEVATEGLMVYVTRGKPKSPQSAVDPK